MLKQLIPDQFEVEDLSEYSGSYSDEIMFGNLFDVIQSSSYFISSSNGNVNINNNTGNRIVLGNNSVGLSTNFFSNIQNNNVYLPYSTYQSIIKDRIFGLNYRFSTNYSENEIYYDSLIPNPITIYQLNGGKLVFSNFENSGWTFFQDYDDAHAAKFIFGFPDISVTSSNGEQISDNTWLQTFPFEARYSSIPRVLNFPDIFDRTIYYEDTQTTYVNYTKITSNGFGITEVGINRKNVLFTEFLIKSSSGETYTNTRAHKTTCEAYGPIVSNSIFNYTASYGWGLTTDSKYNKITNPLLKTFFGFGNGFRNIPTFDLEDNSINYKLSFYFNGFSPKIRGWKFGLYNPTPTPTKAIFRRGRYGQVRDMLEQRLFTKFFSPNKLTSLSSPITITFISGTDAYVTASNPTLNTRQVGYFDTESKVTVPYIENW